MKALSMHLRPAPYPYGLLTLRLLGKLGGKNRKVLREPIDICDPTSFKEYAQRLGVECSWAVAENTNATVANMETSDKSIDVANKEESVSGGENQSFTLQLPLERCVQVSEI
jgi:hypothetical protein